MHLLIFDVDGTLTRTNRLDVQCYLRAVGRHLELGDELPDWRQFEHPTAAGITRELLERVGAEAELTEAIRSSFLEELRRSAEDGAEFASVAGAEELLAELATAREATAAIATGDWAPSSRFKRRQAGLPVGVFPEATSDDAVARAAIIETAIERVRATGKGPFERVTYIGDGTWDRAAARELGIEFVGVGGDEGGAMLREAGAERVVADLEALRGALDR